MCGLAGFSLAPGEVVNARKLAAHLLLGIEHRGKDATGAAWRNRNGNIVVQKHAVDATRFVQSALSVPRRAQSVVLHTRFATQGSHFNNANNHPIRVGSIVGAHNGVLWNDDELFDDLGIADKRIAQVDSEAIFAGLYYGSEEYGNGTLRVPGYHHPTSVLSLLQGTAAVAWMDERQDADVMHVSRVDNSPVAWGQSAEGSFVFGSTFDAVDSAMVRCGMKLAHADFMDEGTYFRLRGGMVAESTSYTTPPSRYSQWAWKGDDYYDDRTSFGHPVNVDTTVIGSVADTTGDAVADEATASYIIEDLDPKVDVPYMVSDAYYAEYMPRELAVDEWMAKLKQEDRAAMTTAMQLKAFVKPGDWVTTQLAGEDYYGQIYECPQTFPHGWYGLMLRVPVSHTAEQHPHETVLVRRMAPDFELVTKAESPAQGTKRAESPAGSPATGTKRAEDLARGTAMKQLGAATAPAGCGRVPLEVTCA